MLRNIELADEKAKQKKVFLLNHDIQVKEIKDYDIEKNSV